MFQAATRSSLLQLYCNLFILVSHVDGQVDAGNRRLAYLFPQLVCLIESELQFLHITEYIKRPLLRLVRFLHVFKCCPTNRSRQFRTVGSVAS